jgi:DNA polymerase-3 subunit delta'
MPFKNIIGHERPIRILKTTLRRNNIAHAYLFYGEEGIGKRLVAKALAQAANCDVAKPLGEKLADDACGECSSCLHIEAETHPDFIAVEPEGTMIKIGQIRTLHEQIQLKPMAGRYRFVILNEAESMNEEAANALLKGLEEPPGQTVLVLVTSKPYAMLPTIVSRCQKIRFTPLTDQQVIMLLKQKKSYEPSQLGRVVALSMGRIGLALETDPKSLEAEWLKFRQIFRCDSSGDMGELLALAQEYAQDRESTQRAIQWIGLLLRDLLMIKVQSKPSSVLMGSSSPPEAGELLKTATELDVEELMAFASLVHWIWKALARNINRQLALEVLLMQIRNTLSQKF